LDTWKEVILYRRLPDNFYDSSSKETTSKMEEKNDIPNEPNVKVNKLIELKKKEPKQIYSKMKILTLTMMTLSSQISFYYINLYDLTLSKKNYYILFVFRNFVVYIYCNSFRIIMLIVDLEKLML